MTITLVRHAQVIEEYQGKYNGHIDIPLSKDGELQAKKLKDSLSTEIYDAIYCSDLLRARQTLEILGYEVKAIFSHRLREKSWGIHEGKSFQEIEESGIKYQNFEQWLHDLDGEDIDDYTNNVEKYFDETIYKSKAKNILIITHSGFIKTLLSIIKQISREKAFSQNLDYASYVKLKYTNKKLSIISL